MKKICLFLILGLCCSATTALACHPLVQCSTSNGTVTANFSFVGGENIAIGTRNQFSPLPINRGQGTNFTTKKNGVYVFGPGSIAAGLKTLSLPVPAGTTLSWTFNGSTVSCTAPRPTPTPTPTCTPPPSDCKGIPGGHAVVDLCGVCGGDNSICKDCAGVPNGTSVRDACGVCNGNGSTCAGCDGVPNSHKILDLCNVCGGDSSTCKDCAGVPNGSSVIDLCGVCGGSSNTCLDCAGVPNGSAKLDVCEVCAGNGTSCLDCAGVPHGTSVVDQCGLCGGDGTSCLDCAGSPFGNQIVDVCGVCGGDGTSCLDCAGVPNGESKLDLCGVCNGSSSCLDCAGIPNGGTQLDCCGVCAGDGTSCPNLCKIYDLKSIKKVVVASVSYLAKDATKRFNGAIKCGGNKKVITSRIQLVKKLRLQISDLLKSFLVDEVKVCDTIYCHKTDFGAIIKLLKLDVNRLFTLDKESQRTNGKACRVGGGSPKHPDQKHTTSALNAIKRIPPLECK